MRSLKLTFASLLIVGLTSAACQRTEQKELALADTTAVAVPLPETGAHKDAATPEGMTTATAAPVEDPQKEIVAIPQAPPRPIR